MPSHDTIFRSEFVKTARICLQSLASRYSSSHPLHSDEHLPVDRPLLHKPQCLICLCKGESVRINGGDDLVLFYNSGDLFELCTIRMNE